MSKVWYGSLQNRLYERCVSSEVNVGDGVTEYCYSDRHAYEVTKVIDDRHILVRALDSKMKPGTDWLDQDYEYTSNESNREIKLFKTKKGQWRERYSNGSLGNIFGIGVACEYRDPSF